MLLADIFAYDLPAGAAPGQSCIDNLVGESGVDHS